MRELLPIGMAFIALTVVLMIGASIFIMTQSVTETVIDDTNNTLLTGISESGGSALTTFTQFLPILAIAIVGGIAVMYLLTFMGGGGRR